MAPEAEAELLRRCRRGETDAWDELFHRHYEAAGRFIFQLGSDFNEQDVAEICQETFLAVIRNIHLFHGHSQFQTWLFRIAGNKARDFRQKQRAAKRGGDQITLSLQAEAEGTGQKLDPPSEAPSPDEELLGKERLELLRQTLDRLGDPCRELIEMRYLGELSYEEISIVLKLNAKTVSSRLSRCLDRLEELARSESNRENSNSFSV